MEFNGGLSPITPLVSNQRILFKIERSFLHSSDGYAYVRIFHRDSSPVGRMQQFGINKVQTFEMAAPWPDIPATLGRFFHQHGSCAHCGKPIASDLAACTCGHAKGMVHLKIRFPHATIPEYQKLMRNEYYRILKARRSATLAANGGTHTADDIEGLFLAQRGCCYYCAKSLVDKSGERRYHRDHYVPVIQGGNDSIHNIVLACPECNIDKGEENGSLYEDWPLGRRHAKTRKLLKEIRTGRALFLERIKTS